jgi:hypothetical protein
MKPISLNLNHDGRKELTESVSLRSSRSSWFSFSGLARQLRRGDPLGAAIDDLAGDASAVLIKPARGWISLNHKDLWSYRELLRRMEHTFAEII